MTKDQPHPSFLNLQGILRKLLPLISIGVIGNLAYSFFATDRHYLQNLTDLSPGWMLVAMLLALLPWGWHCIRLKIWAKFYGHKVAWRDLLHLVVATDVGGAVTPTAVGGAPLKLLMLVQCGFRPGQATLLTLLGNAEDVLFYLLFVPFSLWLTQEWENPLWDKVGGLLQSNGWYLATALVCLLLIALIFKHFFYKNKTRTSWKAKINRTMAELREAWYLIRSKGRLAFLLSMLALVAQWGTRYLVLIAVLLALNFDSGLLQFFLLQWMVFVAILFVPTPGAVGGAEAAFMLVYGTLLPLGLAPIVMMCWRLLTYYFMLLTGAVLLGWKFR